MIICAIRDRMLDYFQPPVCVNRVQDLMAAIAKGINDQGETRHEIGQAPDHYELWQIGEVDDQGYVHAKREFIANCASFVRNGLRARREQGAAGAEGQRAEIQGGSRAPGGPARAKPGTPTGTEGSKAQPDQKPNTDVGRSDPANTMTREERQAAKVIDDDND